MVYILDKDISDKILEIEDGGVFYERCLLNPESHYSLTNAIRQYQERCLIACSDFTNEEFSFMLDLFNQTIYGSGGWNRYHVNGFGEVKISKYHSTSKAVSKAIELGFEFR